jgi:autotransporter-associated beta strand protein
MKSKNKTLKHLGFIALALVGLAANSAQAATETWTGATDTWNTAGNWSGTNLPPISGDSLIFGAAGAGGTTLNNDLTSAAFNVAGITFNSAASAYTIGGNDFTLTGGITNSSTTKAQIINNAMAFTTARTITTSNAAAGITLGGVLSGTGGSLVITGPGAVTISNASNSFNNGVTIGNGTGSGNTGILRAAASGALGSGTVTTTGNASASRLELTSGITLSNAISLGGVASTTTSGIQNISGSNTLSGTIDLQSGGVEHQIQSDAGLLTLGTATATAITTTTTSARNVTLQGAGDGAVVGNIIDGTNGGTRAITVKKAGAGTWTLSGANTYTGGTTINLGTILLGNNSALGSGTVLLGSGGIGNDSALLTNGAFAITGGKITANFGGGGRVLGGNTATVSSFANNIDVNTGAFQVSQIAGGNLTLSGTINGTFGANGLMTFTNQGSVNVTGNITNTVAGLQVTQSGPGTTTFSGTNTYSGATNVNAGTLAVNGNQIAATGAVTVSNSGTRLIGTGTLGASTTTINSGAIHSAGGAVANLDKVGLQTFDQTLAATSDLTYGASSIFEWDLNANSNLSGARGTGYDGVDVTGTLAVDSTSIFRVVLGSGVTSAPFWQTTQTWANIFGGGFTLSGSGFNNSLLEIVNSSGGAYDLNTLNPGYQFTVSGTSLTWSAVPEPSSALIGMLVTAGLLRRRRKN